MLVTFEGIDGSGKSTQARLLVERMEEEGYHALLVREPGGTGLSERVREVLLDASLRIDPLAELLLFSAARAQLVSERIQPALAEGQIVVCDRFYDSTTAYQGAGRAVADQAWIQAFNQHVTAGLKPHRTYYIAVPLAVAQARQTEAGTAKDRMEQADVAFYERVIAAYEQIATHEAERFHQLDGCQSVERLHRLVWSDVQETLRGLHGTPVSARG
jgi:dTMP kinase